jgi:polyhydroxyalkanoate synthesis regulator phasin
VNFMVTRKVSEPVQDALKAYLELALGLTEASKKKAEKAVKKMAKELVGKGNSTAAQIQGAVEDLVATSASNREAVTRLVRVEMDRTLSRVGLATSEEVATLQARVDALERELRDERAAAGKSATPVKVETPAGKAPAERKATVGKKAKATVVKKAPVVKKEPTVKAAPPAADVPVAPKKVTAKKADKKAVRPSGETR